jgi:hypothetical protein
VAGNDPHPARRRHGVRGLRHREDVEEGVVLGSTGLDPGLEAGAREHLERAGQVQDGHAVEDQHADVPLVHSQLRDSLSHGIPKYLFT